MFLLDADHGKIASFILMKVNFKLSYTFFMKIGYILKTLKIYFKMFF